MSDQTNEQHAVYDPDQFYLETKKFLLENYNIRIEAQPNDPIMIEIYVVGQMIKVLNEQMSDLHSLSYQRNVDLTKQWLQAEEQAVQKLQSRYDEIINKNSENLNQVFQAAMKKAILQTQEELVHSNDLLKVITVELRKTNQRIMRLCIFCAAAVIGCISAGVLSFV